jgi:hypothetical protein
LEQKFTIFLREKRSNILFEIETYSQKRQNNITQCINFKEKKGKIVKSSHKPPMSLLFGFSTSKQWEGFPSFIPSLPFLPLPFLTFPSSQNSQTKP